MLPPGAGNYGFSDRLNFNGRAILELARRHGLGIANTLSHAGCGPTYFGMDGDKSRIDYIFPPHELLSTNLQQVTTIGEAGSVLQRAQQHLYNIDHIPLHVKI